MKAGHLEILMTMFFSLRSLKLIEVTLEPWPSGLDGGDVLPEGLGRDGFGTRNGIGLSDPV